MLADEQHEALAAMERQLGSEEPELARALDAMASELLVSRSVRCVRWLTFSLVVVAPLGMVAALVLLPLAPAVIVAVLFIAGIFASPGVRRARGRRAHDRRVHGRRRRVAR